MRWRARGLPYSAQEDPVQDRGALHLTFLHYQCTVRLTRAYYRVTVARL